MNILENCRKYKYANEILVLITTITLFLQNCFFHWQAFHSILISTLWKAPLVFLTFYGTKISISLFIASFITLFKSKSWIIYVSLIIGIWSISELVYFRANGIFLDAYSFAMIGNMNGFWSSVPMYIYKSDLLIFIPTIILIATYYVFQNKTKNNHIYIYIIISIFLNILTLYGLVNFNFNYLKNINPFSKDVFFLNIEPSKTKYINCFSVTHSLIFDIKDLILMPFENDSYILSNEEIKQTKNFINNNPTIKKNINSRTIIILVESFETWSIDKHITPNLFNLISNQSSILFANKVKTQTKGGTSADGQMIINTGLLPISRGAVCYKYPLNTFPSLAKIHQTSAAIIPGSLSVWNQKYMSDSYGISENFETTTDDRDIFNKLNTIYNQYDYILAITMSSHTPFNSYTDREINVPSDMPELMQNYLKSINYMDEQLGTFINKIETDSILKNSIIIITGDHTIFPTEIRNEFYNYCKNNNQNYKVEEDYSPLIIYSPNIQTKYIENEVLQMDIYPTILDVIGCKDYNWKGFGVSLLDSTNLANRPISEEDAYILSDKLIRANYFKEVEDNLNVYK